MYKKKLFCLFLIAFSMPSAYSADVKLNLMGTITLNTCSVTTTSKNKYVNLGTWGAKQFSSVGIKTVPIPFTIDLENCNGSVSSISGVNIIFSGTSITENTKAFTLNGSSSAKNIGILILDKNKNIIEPNTNSVIYDLDPNQTNFSLVFYGQYISTSTPVIPGSANSDITFSITYN